MTREDKKWNTGMFYNIFFKRDIHWYLSRMLGEAVRDMVQKDEYDKEVHVRNGS